MSVSTEIQWTEATWNPVTGCTPCSPGCRHCYAARMALRLQAMGQENYRNGFQVTTHEQTIGLPQRWRRPKKIFVNSMGDLFHEAVPDEFITKVFGAMNAAPWHRYQVLTKRSERLASMSDRLPWSPHIWAGVTVENNDCLPRVDHLRQTGAAVKFLSLEPLLGALPGLDLTGMDWVIVGGESGPGARPMQREWVTDLRDACVRAHVPFFFKQWGGVNKKAAGRQLDGRTWDEWPAVMA